MVEFTDRNSLERWLEDKPREWAVVIAARSALRVVPLLSTAINSDVRYRNPIGELFLAIFRGTSLSWVTAAFGDRDTGGPEWIRYLDSARFAAQDCARAAHAFEYAANAQNVAYAARDAVSVVVKSITDDRAVVSQTAVQSVSFSAVAANVATATIWKAAFVDAVALKSNGSTDLYSRKLSQYALWPEDMPNWAINNWHYFKKTLSKAEDNWDVWFNWYEERLRGDSAIESLEVARVLIPEEIWDHGPKLVNAHIRRLIDEFDSGKPKPPEDSGIASEKKPPKIPAPRRAAVEPIWEKGRLTLPKKVAKTDLNGKKFTSALLALRGVLRELADDVAKEANIDKRPSSFLSRLAERIPEKNPTQDELFRLGHVESVFSAFARTVDQEWPDFLAARYHAVAIQFDRTMRQSPLWREFKRNAAKESLSPEQVNESISLAKAAASALQQEEGKSFVDRIIPSSLEQLAEAVPSAAESANPDVIEAGKELLAADLVESVNNVLKPIAGIALEAARGYAESAGKGFVRAAKKQGKIDGEKAFKWLRRLVIGGVGGTGSFVALSTLIAKYPQAFGWLTRVLQYLN